MNRRGAGGWGVAFALGLAAAPVPLLGHQEMAEPVVRDTAAADTTAVALSGGAVPVVVAGDTLFQIAGRIGPFPPKARVRAIEGRLRSLIRDPRLRLDRISVFHGEMTSDLLIGDFVIMTVTDGDATTMNMERRAAAERYAEILTEALREQSVATNLRAIALGVLFALLATVALVFVLRGVGRVLRRVCDSIRRIGPERLPAIRIQRLELVPKGRIVETLVMVARLTRLVLTLVLLYVYVPLVLSFFPWTRRLARTWLQYILEPVSVVIDAVVSYLPNLFFIAVIVVVGYYAVKVIRLIFAGIEHETITFKRFHSEWAEPTYKIVRVFVIALIAIVIIPYLPRSESAAFKGVGAFLALLISLGSASAIANVMAGTMMVYMRPYRIGDRVRIADTVGGRH